MLPNEKTSDVVITEAVRSGTSKIDLDGFLTEDISFATRAIHGGYQPSEETVWAISPPIHLSTTFKQRGPAMPYRFEYSRSGNPSREMLENTLSKLDNGDYGLCFASGLGALSVIIQMLKTGDHLLCMDDVYGGTARYIRHYCGRNNIEVTFTDLSNSLRVKEEVKTNTKLVCIETPTNPLMKVVDISEVCKVIKQINDGTIVVVDNTFLTSYFQKPLTLGADIVLYSVTKYMNGHADVVMGATVTNNKKLYEEMKYLQNASGIIPSPFDCYLVLRSLKTLKVRMDEHMKSGIIIARFLKSHPAVESVLYPGLESHPGHCVSKKQTSGCSGVISFYLKGGLEESKKFLSLLKYFQIAESLGGYESLAEIPSLMTHASVSPDVREALCITDNLIRLSVGLESIDDLLNDLNGALNNVVAHRK